MKQEYEIVNHPYIKYVNLFMAQIGYRTPHLHRDIELMFIAKGNASFISAQKPQVFNEGEFVIMNSNELHEIKDQGENSLMICLQVSPKYFKQIFPQIENLKFNDMKVEKYLSKYELEEIKDNFLSLANTYFSREEGYELLIAQLISSIFYKIIKSIPNYLLTEEEKRNSFVKAERLNRILSYMEEHFMEKVGLSDIAKEEGLSVSFLSHFITENLNQTFQEYLKGLRLNRAVELIMKSDMKLIDICVASGFSDYRYLNQAFTKKFGCTPKEYSKIFKPLPDVKTRLDGSTERIYTEKETKDYLNQKGI